jgi:pyruvate/2-oxoacid:ferredoxin oxidoreductase beta subunit
LKWTVEEEEEEVVVVVVVVVDSHCPKTEKKRMKLQEKQLWIAKSMWQQKTMMNSKKKQKQKWRMKKQTNSNLCQERVGSVGKEIIRYEAL